MMCRLAGNAMTVPVAQAILKIMLNAMGVYTTALRDSPTSESWSHSPPTTQSRVCRIPIGDLSSVGGHGPGESDAIPRAIAVIIPEIEDE